MSDDRTVGEQIADALFAYNTPAAHHFVIHDGGYEEIAKAALEAIHDAGYRIVTTDDAAKLDRLRSITEFETAQWSHEHANSIDCSCLKNWPHYVCHYHQGMEDGADEALRRVRGSGER